MACSTKRKKKCITKTELVDVIYQKSSFMKKDIHSIINLFLNEMDNQLSEGNEIVLQGFGNFIIKQMKERNFYCNPKAKGPVRCKPYTKVSFKMSQTLKRNVSKDSSNNSEIH